MSHSDEGGLRNRKRRVTTARIAVSAAKLAVENGIAGTTVDQIADDAQVARATFFRYYQTKESAVADGLNSPWLTPITDAIARQPPHLTAMETIIAAFAEVADELSDDYPQMREVAELTRNSTTLAAWTLRCHQHYEQVIADLLAPRVPGLADNDPRPRMIAALAMAAVRISLDDWLDQGGSLPDLIQRALRSIDITAPPPPATSPPPR